MLHFYAGSVRRLDSFLAKHLYIKKKTEPDSGEQPTVPFLPEDFTQAL